MFMARVTAIGRVSGRVAGLAGDFSVATVVQREGVSVQWSRKPTLYGMAVIAARSKETGVNGWFCMTGCTLQWGAAEMTIFMTVGALQAGVLARQRENHLVVKAMQAVDAIMAGQTAGAILLDVNLHEGLIMSTVAGHAGRRVKLHRLSGVASCTQHGGLVVIDRMQVKGETYGTVVKRFALVGSGLPGKSGVASGAVRAKHPGMGSRFGMTG
jgi:hypothetical protein